MSKRLLVVDDDGDMGELLQDSLTTRGWEVTWKARAEEAFEALQNDEFDAVVTDLNLEGMSGIELCQRVMEKRPDIPIIVITAFGCMDAAISALRARACDFMNKPVDMSVLSHSLERALQHRDLKTELKRLRQEVSRSRTPGELVGQSSAMLKLFDLIRRVSNSQASVLLTGESGTGKELVARALHLESPRAERPFIAINCAAVPENLLESELFGHTRGAFTDAKTARKGLFEEADGGTLLLDEVGEMPLAMQAKLLRVLQERRGSLRRAYHCCDQSRSRSGCRGEALSRRPVLSAKRRPRSRPPAARAGQRCTLARSALLAAHRRTHGKTARGAVTRGSQSIARS
jgi:two-component system, NtrC family, response regulator AtoC